MDEATWGPYGLNLKMIRPLCASSKPGSSVISLGISQQKYGKVRNLLLHIVSSHLPSDRGSRDSGNIGCRCSMSWNSRTAKHERTAKRAHARQENLRDRERKPRFPMLQCRKSAFFSSNVHANDPAPQEISGLLLLRCTKHNREQASTLWAGRIRSVQATNWKTNSGCLMAEQDSMQP
jgi:hypothetical protein